ncbi:hypothetical protein OSB04_un001343 [Centaurea solstitialis]|uniref:Reverse transcriptase domain-containing protein n=1 Tax=Centaurea solstitialis TaxID=347529 RepID=A0AA38VQZ3_9ASTR|nr:hypothetical protein OSB04_un001343 [Centaurea solstitialis]
MASGKTKKSKKSQKSKNSVQGDVSDRSLLSGSEIGGLVTPIVKLEGVVTPELNSMATEEVAKSDIGLVDNLEAIDDSIAGEEDDSEDLVEGVLDKENSNRPRGSVGRISNLKRILRNALGVNMDSSISSAISKDIPQELSSLGSPKRNEKKVEAISNSIVSLSTGKSDLISDKVDLVPAISVIDKSASINVEKILKQVKEANVVIDKEKHEVFSVGDSDNLKGSVGGSDESQNLGEYMKDSEQYLKNVINMFNRPTKESLIVGGGGSIQVKDRKMAAENLVPMDGVNCNQRSPPKFSFGVAVDGADLVMDDADSVQVGTNGDANEKKNANPWGFNGVTLADKIRGNTDSKVTLSFKAPIRLEDGRQVVRFSKEVIMEGAKTNPMLIVAHFVGASLPFFVLNNSLNRLWKRCGLVNVASNYKGYYLLKFNNEEGMKYVLENGPWMINGVPLFVKKWEVGYYLERPDLKKLPVWVNLYGVPLEVWNVKGLSELASGIGVPLALDRATEERCLKQMGRAGFARVLVEVTADRSICDEVVCLMPSLDGLSEKEVIVRAEYSWKPPRCSHCCTFGHSFAACGMRPLTEAEKSVKAKMEEKSGGKNMDDGFQVMGKRNRPVAAVSKGNVGNGQPLNTRGWVNQRFGPRKEEVKGVKVSNGASLGSQNRGERSWQVRKQGIQVQNGIDKKKERVFEVGQSSGVKKVGTVDKKNGQQIGVRNQGQQQEGRKMGMFSDEKEGVGVRIGKESKSGTGLEKKQGNAQLGRRVVIKGKENQLEGGLDSQVVLEQIPLNNSFELLNKSDALKETEMFEDDGDDFDENFDEEFDEKEWLEQKRAVNGFIEQGIFPSKLVFDSWNVRQIEYFRSVQRSCDVFENQNVPDFMQSVEEDLVGKGKGIAGPGLNLASKRKEVKRLIGENGLCLFALVETKVIKGNLRKFCREIFGNWGWVSNNSVCEGRTRIIVGWDPNIVKLEFFEFFEQVIHGRFLHISSNKSFFCSWVYAANDVVARRFLWDQLREFKQMVKEDAWLILGDFNVSLDPSDSSRGSSAVSRGMIDFRECLKDIEVEDINASGLHFTWSQKPLAKEGSKGLLKKIDRVLGNLCFVGDFPSAHVSFLPFGVSDHSPAVVSLPNLSSFRPRPFKFCNYLADNKGFLPLVLDAWSLDFPGCSMFSVVSKLKVVKKGLRKLKLDHGDVSKNVERLRGDLERIQLDCDLDPENGDLRDLGAVYLKALKDALCDEEKFLRQRSKVQWLKEGDSNTAYFHSMVKSNVNRSRIEEVESMDGKCFIGSEVPNQFVLHFKRVLGTSEAVETIFEPDSLFLKKLSKEQADFMVRPIDDKEIREAIFGIDDLKAPGPDGFSSRFYKKSWPVIGSEICEAVKQFFHNGKLLKEVNATVLSLVPKSQTPRKVADFRPIACCNVLYKCISKVLVGRLKNYLDVLVDKNQSAFIPNRQICDNVLLAQELMRGYHRQRGTRRCAFKVDIQKAYDTVNWSFLETALKWFGFHPWSMENIMGFFPGMRGLRQGDPLSPYLFTLVMEVLTLMVKRKVKDSSEFKFHPRCEKIGLTHLSFADDLLMFCYGDSASVKVLKDALMEFGGVSGLKPSMEKSTCFLGNVVGINRKEILEVLPFKLGTLPVRYLGVPLISTKLFHRDCLVLIDKVKKRVLDWKNKWLSFAGRLQLINSVLSSISVYWASLFLIPISAVKEIDKLLRSFLWSNGEAVRGKAKVAWKTVCTPRSKGGLGVRDLRKWNHVLLTKQIWKIIGNGENLWVKWIHEYRLKGKCFWDVGSVFDAPWFWIKMVRFREKFRDHLVHMLGDGRSTFLWSDNWHLAGPLCKFITRREVYMAGLDWNMKVADLVVDGLWMWPPFVWRKIGLVLNVFQPSLKSGVRDKIMWRNKEGILLDCRVNFVWNDLYFDYPNAAWSNLIWFSQGIPRHAFFLWLAIKEKLRTLDRLGAWKVTEDSLCVLCNDGMESHSHLFVECSYSKEVWRCLEGMSGVYNLILNLNGADNSWADLVSELIKVNYGKSIWSVVHRLLFAAGVYFLWQERNKRRHGEAHRSCVVLARQILDLIRMKLMGLRVKNNSQTRRVASIWDLKVENDGFHTKSDFSGDGW